MLIGDAGLQFTRRGLRAASGLTLFAFVATHLANHALGLASLDAAAAARVVFVGFWRSLPGTALLYSAASVHVALALAALYERRTLRMPPGEIVRLALGLTIPFLLASHFAATRAAHELYGIDDPYTRVVWSIWSADGGARQLTIMTVAWIHGCLGVRFMARHRPWYRQRSHFLFAGAVLLPVLAFLGYVSMAREVEDRSADPAWFAAHVQARLPAAAQRAALTRLADAIELGFAALLAGVLAARLGRTVVERRRRELVTLRYPGRAVQVPRGWSVLEASRAYGIPHMSLCGGRARCSTCRVSVEDPGGRCPPPGPEERRTLARISAARDVRLACQLRPTGDIGVMPLLRPGADSSGVTETQFGLEREVVIVFVDLRRWTGVAENQLPYDLVYVLELYFAAVGDAVREAGGVPNQFIGDSVMAIFGLESDLAAACRQALAAARGIERRMGEINDRLEREFGQRFGFGMGVHAGPAAVGEVGYRDTRTLSAVGDAVNTASRLQELAKRYGARLVISEPVARGAGLDTTGLQARTLEIRGRTTPLVAYVLETVQRLPASDADERIAT
ncbi:MAG TPA: adenylate/guanylate cyclase domain-containing protein [Burkholderiales bacterium]|nr:adenylate/guanylate cyclase domain-containing protein [Burkholderiales bacterium]